MRVLLPFIRLFNYAKFPLVLGLILMTVGLAASIGLLTLSGWFLAATSIAGLGTLFNFFYPSAGVRGLAIGRTISRYFEKLITHDATFRILAKLRVQVFEKIIPLSPAVLNRYRNSDLLNRLVSDVDTLDSLYLRLIAPFLSAIIVILAMTIGLAFINTALAILLGTVLFTLLILIPIIFYQLGKRFGDKLVHSRAIYRTQFLEFIQAQAELLLFAAEDRLKKNMAITEQTWQTYQQKEANLSAFSTALLLFINGIIVAFTLWFSSTAEFGEDIYRLAFIALFTFAALASIEILMPLGAAFLHIGQTIAAAERVNNIITQPPLVRFNGNTQFEHSESPLIQFNNVSFIYPERTNTALSELNLTINQKQKVAVLGKTGSGKSTLLQLLVRNYNTSKGEILLSGKPISLYTEQSLRQQICFLTQRVHIFSDTLRNNLQLSITESISDEKMSEILMQVGLKNLLIQEQGLDLWIGDGGRPLSGGEQRRLGLARILLNDAPILFLDEPTEGLDRETERHILQLILEHAKHKTLIMVTHRLTALEQFDLLCVIDDSKLIEHGSYQELLDKDGAFNRLVSRI
ncbi:heme ABC transporter ATP-binding protein/permease CydC [Rodentibacter caecimuris]|uniref:Cysteine/glutathione ABC transporter ATP-binding protein/permease CydC n=1 Tax=Rodentibacter caecimuris TaxID=1796644 RepID=A0ABX3KWP5_9PAST|nr:cysteine/glutathione ABC transporter ATP-binding protein/permease CydC [Rodentibacter heylii]